MQKLNLSNIPITIELPVQHGFERVTRKQAKEIQLQKGLQMVTSLFRIIHFVAVETHYTEHKFNQEFADLAEIGDSIVESLAKQF